MGWTMYFIEKMELCKKNINDFTSLVNIAFLGRSKVNHFNAFTEISPLALEEELVENNCTVFVAKAKEEPNKIIGGIVTKVRNGDCLLFKAAVSPEFQGQGIASNLIKKAKEFALQSNCKTMSLGVGSVWKGAIHTYKKAGFIKTRVEAHVPGSYKLFEMKYFFNGISFFKKIKIKLSYFISLVKFNLLFKKDSTPNWLHKKLFKGRKPS